MWKERFAVVVVVYVSGGLMAGNEGSSSGGDGSGLTLSVKMLDSTVHSVTVPSANVLVSDLKRAVSEVAGVPADRQRLIFRGAVLKDEKTLAEYRMESGFVIHLVVSPEGRTNNRGGATSAAEERASQQRVKSRKNPHTPSTLTSFSF